MQVEELGLGSSASNAGTWKVNYEFGEYDPNTQTVTGSKNTGNIARQTVSFDGLPNAFVQTYQYDSLYRLTNANEKAGTTENWKQDFTYDRYGNRLTHNKFINGNPITHNNQTHPTIDPNTNRFNAGQNYGYDKVGNLITDAEGRTFTFDGNNKQRFITDGNNATVGEYFYDGDGMRVKKHVYSGGTLSKTVIFVYSGGKLVEEYSSETPPTEKKIKYMTEDHLGTPRVITDGSGAVVSRRDFMPFGEDLGSTVGTRSTSSFKYASQDDDVRQKFTGYQKDEETQLDFAEARMYENRHARFTAVDPLLASGNSANPQTFNRYVYVFNNPIAFVDSSGLIPVYFNKKKGRFTTNRRAKNWKGYTRYRGGAKKIHGRFNGRKARWHWVTNNGIYETRSRRGRNITRRINRRKKKRNRKVTNWGVVKQIGGRGTAARNLYAITTGAGAAIGACIGGLCPAVAPALTVGGATGAPVAVTSLAGASGATLALPETACGSASSGSGGGGGSGGCGGIAPVNGSIPRNSKYAGEKYPLPPDLAEKYPDGLYFKENGYPDFSPYAEETVKLDYMRGDTYYDFLEANELAGLPEKPKHMTWHHVEDLETMQLVPKDLHNRVGHTGARAIIKHIDAEEIK